MDSYTSSNNPRANRASQDSNAGRLKMQEYKRKLENDAEALEEYRKISREVEEGKEYIKEHGKIPPSWTRLTDIEREIGRDKKKS